MPDFDHTQFANFLQQFALDEELESFETLTNGFSNRSFRLKTKRPDSSHGDYVVKRYAQQEHSTGQSKKSRAKLEYAVLNFLNSTGIHCPEALYFNLQDTILDSAVLVTKGIAGAQIMAHPANPLWAEKTPIVAEWLARIHQVNCPETLRSLLPIGSSSLRRFSENTVIPDYMAEHPDGESIWQLVRENIDKLSPEQPALVHGDYWSGNILWENEQVTGILDWENLSLGHAGLDVAYCRMEMFIDGMDEAAASFLSVYEKQMGATLSHLGLCELVVATDPLWQHAPYLNISPYQERFRQFVANAKKHL